MPWKTHRTRAPVATSDGAHAGSADQRPLGRRTPGIPPAFGWPIVWGLLLAAPDVRVAAMWPRMAAACAVVWLMAWAAVVADDPTLGPSDHVGAQVPGGAGATAAAGLAVAALLGPSSLFVAAAALIAHLGLRSLAPLRRPVAGALRAWAAGLLAWTAVGGSAAAVPAGEFWASTGALGSAAAWAAVNGGAILTLAGCAGALSLMSRSPDERPRSAMVAAAALVAVGLTGSDRPAGLWLAVLIGAASWLGSVRMGTELGTASIARDRWLPLALAGVCAIDSLIG